MNDPRAIEPNALLVDEFERCIAQFGRMSVGEDLAASELSQLTRTAIRLVRNLDEARIGTLMHAFEQIASGGDAALVSRLHAMKSNLALRRGHYEECISEAKAGRAVAIRAGLEQEVATCCVFAGSACQWSGRLTEAEAWFEEAVVAARRCADLAAEAGALSSRSILLRMRGDTEASLRALDEASRLYVALGHEAKLGRCRLSRGVLFTRTGRLVEAENELRLAIADFQASTQAQFVDYARLGLVRVLFLRGQLDEATALLETVAPSSSATTDPRMRVISLEYAGDIALEQANTVSARSSYESALSLARSIGDKTDLFVEASYRHALALALSGDTSAQAQAEAANAVETAVSQGDQFERSAALCSYGRVLAVQGQTSKAELVLRSCLDVAGRIGDRLNKATAALALSRVTFELGNPVEAAGLAHEARREFAQLPSPRWLAETETWLTELMAKLATAVAASTANAAASAGATAAGAAPSSAKPSSRRPIPAPADQGPVAGIPGFITADSSTRQMLATTLKIAPRSLSILVLGESGTGKEVVAEAIHVASDRKGPFVPVNCGALPGDLLEAELFGHARGAYTGADRERGGLIEHSHRGTLFLDEIGDMPLKAQARLLRALERGEVRRLGENSPRLVDLRIIAATHRNLLDMVSAGDFRLDLYHRLTGFVLKLPPLRDRPADVLLLVDHFLKVFAAEQDKDVRLSPDVRQELAHHGWPGNVRQLRNVLHRLVSLGEPGQVIARLPFELEGAVNPRTLPEHLDAEEKRRIVDALQSHNWNKAKAAIALGSSRTTLIGKMKRLGIDMEAPGARVR